MSAASLPPPTGNAFTATMTSPFSLAGTYRVFGERNDLIFIQVESGAKSIADWLGPLLGPAGGLVPLVLWLFKRKKTDANLKRLETGNPEDLLHSGEGNFKLYLAEIRDAAIEAPSMLMTHGKGGRLNLVVRHNEKMKLEFKEIGDMTNAIHLLTSLLSSTLRLNVEWNGQRHRFEKKR